MTYEDACKRWHSRFLKAVKKKRKIGRDEFLKKIDICVTNGSCYYKGTKIAKPQKISVMCIQINIPLEEIFF